MTTEDTSLQDDIQAVARVLKMLPRFQFDYITAKNLPAFESLLRQLQQTLVRKAATPPCVKQTGDAQADVST